MDLFTRVLLIAVVVLFGATSSADAGWVLSQTSGEEVVISNGKMRSDSEPGGVIFDGTTGVIHFFDDARKVYASGTADEICADMEQMIEKMMERVPAEQREMMKKMMGDGNAPKVEVVDKGAGEKVSGFATTRYEVMADGELYEEVWITNDKKLMKDCEAVMKMMGKFTSCMESMSAMSGVVSPEASEQYMELFDKGMMVKTTKHGVEGSDHAENIEGITEQDIPDAKFAVPDGYKNVSFPAMFGMAAE
jgi:hypothetical protein